MPVCLRAVGLSTQYSAPRAGMASALSPPIPELQAEGPGGSRGAAVEGGAPADRGLGVLTLRQFGGVH